MKKEKEIKQIKKEQQHNSTTHNKFENHFTEIPMVSFIRTKNEAGVETEREEWTTRGYSINECLQSIQILKNMFDKKK